jgi:hypothetical protein
MDIADEKLTKESSDSQPHIFKRYGVWHLRVGDKSFVADTYSKVWEIYLSTKHKGYEEPYYG